MNALEDTRPIVSITTASTNPSVIGEDLGYLLGQHPGLELASIRLIREDQGVHIVGRVGTIAQPAPSGPKRLTWPVPPLHRECSSCHTVAPRPHTEYCHLVDHASQLTHAELEPNLAKHVKAARCICPGLGINPDCPRHNHNPAEDEPEQDEQDAIAAADESAAAAEAEQRAYPS